MATQKQRPLSPHLLIYRPQITSVLSIAHRFTGVVLSFGALVLTYWLTSAAYGPEAFARAQAVLGSWFGRLMLLGLTFSLFFHFCNGIRHLVWDAGWGFEMNQLRATGWLVVTTSMILTLASWFAAYAVAGGS
ncbi:MAG: succinate dehydrogenase, cytochrome b556 subunit [Rhodospirillales bacterium]|jgi:succinate dehydrogenase / fumarate reductase cytochrome b subunit|nr:succinate dehydrogenase, cytochrome b556 subunit [Rhodospirillales bacterium]MDP6804253.1 succinate dehydrogenase, cytochrome b556 subunit [Rhodospirillales bacterium]